MQEYLLILKGDGMNHLSPEELQRIMMEYKEWVRDLGDRYLGGQRLDDNGALLTDRISPVLTDGPFLESKEIIAGFMLINANDQDEAIKLARALPHLGLYQIEVRPISFPRME